MICRHTRQISRAILDGTKLIEITTEFQLHSPSEQRLTPINTLERRIDQFDLPDRPTYLFADGAQAWEKGHMNLRRLFRSIIALTVAAGLMSAPLATTAFAKPDASAG